MNEIDLVLQKRKLPLLPRVSELLNCNSDNLFFIFHVDAIACP